MITSRLESLCISFLLGGCLDCHERGCYADVQSFAESILQWCVMPGITEAGQESYEAGIPLRTKRGSAVHLSGKYTNLEFEDEDEVWL